MCLDALNIFKQEAASSPKVNGTTKMDDACLFGPSDLIPKVKSIDGADFTDTAFRQDQLRSDINLECVFERFSCLKGAVL